MILTHFNGNTKLRIVTPINSAEAKRKLIKRLQKNKMILNRQPFFQIIQYLFIFLTKCNQSLIDIEKFEMTQWVKPHTYPYFKFSQYQAQASSNPASKEYLGA